MSEVIEALISIFCQNPKIDQDTAKNIFFSQNNYNKKPILHKNLLNKKCPKSI